MAIKVEVEGKREFLILLFAQSDDLPATSESFYQDYLQETISTYDLAELEPRMVRDPDSQLGLLLDISTAAQAVSIKPWLFDHSLLAL